MKYTTKEQSKRLLELGLDPSTADLTLNIYREKEAVIMKPYRECKEFFNVSEIPSFLIPCWSLDELLELMPYEIKEDRDTYRLLVTHKLVQYPRLTTLWPSLYNSHGDSTFEAAYNMIVWLLENKYITINN